MTSPIAVRLVANGEAMIAEFSRAGKVISQNGKAIAQEMGSQFGDDLKKGLREAEATARASFKSLGDVVNSATNTNGAIQFDVAGARAATQAAQDRLEKLQAVARAYDSLIAKEGQASAATRTYALAIQESIREETQNIDVLNSKAVMLERLQGELGQTAAAQSRVTAVSGQTRAGMQQLSFQVSDVAASFVNGVSPMVIFAQQSGQVIQAMGMMGTKATGLMALMANPWFLAITSAVTVLGTLAYNHYKAGDASDAQRKKEKSLTESIHDQNEALQKNIQLQGQRISSDLAGAKTSVVKADASVAYLKDLVLRKEAEIKQILTRGPNPEEGYRGILKAKRSELEELNGVLNKFTVAQTNANQAVRAAQIAATSASVDAQFDKSIAETQRYEKALGLANEQYKKTGDLEAYTEKTKELRGVHDANKASLESETKAQRESNKEREKTLKLPAVTMKEVAGLIGAPITSGTRSAAKNKAINGSPTSYHLTGQAIDIPLTVNGKPITKAGIRAALEPAGVIIKELLGPGDKDHDDHFHVAFDLKRATSDKVTANQQKVEDDAAKSAERQAESYKRISDQITGQIENLKTVAEVDRLRSEGLTIEAEKHAAIAQLRGQYKDILEGEPAVAAVVLGLTVDQVKAMRDQLAIAEKLTVEGIQRRTQEELNTAATEKQQSEQKKRLKEIRDDQEQKREEQRKAEEQQYRDLAAFYERAFRSGGKSIWSDFKQLGRRAIADLAAQATLSLLGNIGGGAAPGGGQGGGLFSGISQMLGGGRSAGGNAGGGAGGFNLGGLTSALGPIAAGVQINQSLAKLLGADQKKNGMLLSLIGGPLFAKMVGSTLRGSATLNYAGGALGVGATRGNSRSRIGSSSGAVGSLAEMLSSVAESLGGSISGAGGVSIGVRKKGFVVDTSGQGRTKGNGVLKFKTEQEAIQAAFRDALQDGVIAGISAASQKILAAGGNLQKAIEKAAMIESIPKALKARMNPVGAALDALNEKWDKMIAALKEGGATAEQLADAEKLYRLERTDAMKAANDNLKEFINSLNFGSSSNYSLPDQLKALRKDLDLYLGQINSGSYSEVDQQRYLQLAGQDLDILREIEGSGAGYFSRVDELRNATQRLADNLGIGSAEATRDPFAETTATNTAATAAGVTAVGEILAQQSQLLTNISQQLTQMNAASNNGGFIGTNRRFVRDS